MSLVESLIRAIAPSCCVVCNKEGVILCNECLATDVAVRKPACFWCNTLTPKGQTCSRCRNKTSLSGATVPFRYDGVVKDLIYRLKYDGNTEVAEFFAQHITPFIQPDRFDVVSFVPTTGASQRRRGYNQAKVIAQKVSQHTNLPLQNLLLRERHIDQIGLNRAQRLAAVEGNFVPTSRRSTNKRVLLIDDVITTGATMDECAKILKDSGAKQVWALAIAKK